MPQVTLVASQQNVAGLRPGVRRRGRSTSSTRRCSAGWRQIYYPSVSFPLRTPLFYVTPKAGVNYTRYSFPGDSDVADGRRARCRSSAWTAAPASSATPRSGGRDFVQTLEPRLYYLYIPFRDQTQLPVFDTRSRISTSPASSARTVQRRGPDQRCQPDHRRCHHAPDRSCQRAWSNCARWSASATTSSRRKSRWPALCRPRRLPDRRTRRSRRHDTTSSRSDLLAAFSGALTRTWSLDTGLQYGVSRLRVAALQRRPAQPARARQGAQLRLPLHARFYGADRRFRPVASVAALGRCWGAGTIRCSPARCWRRSRASNIMPAAGPRASCCTGS